MRPQLPLALIALACVMPFSAGKPEPRLLAATFSSASGEGATFAGHWRGGGVSLVLAPRLPRSAGGPSSLFGAIPAGDMEGALHVPFLPHPNSLRPEAITVEASFVSATPPLTTVPAQLTWLPSGPALQLRVAGRRGVTLARVGEVNAPLLAAVRVAGHRGSSLGRKELMNTLPAFEHAWLLGCSGLEMDIIVPHRVVGGRRVPAPADLRVVHPPDVRTELSGLDTMNLDQVRHHPVVEAALDAAGRGGVRFVYLDLKLRWLRRDRPALRRALEQGVAVALAALKRHPHLTIAIGAETHETAEAVADLAASGRWPRRLAWAAELTRGTGADAFYYRAAARGPGRPGLLSFNLLRIRGGRGGLLELLLPDLRAEWERRLADVETPRMFWTAASVPQFAGALSAAARMTPPGTTREVAVLTPFPHRLAYYLATRPAAF